MERKRPEVIHFGVFEVDLANHTLRKAGIRIRLQEQPLQLLAALLERPGEVVTREELKERLWPDARYGEFDPSLNQAVRKIRRALDDSPLAPKWIETVPKVGYRFVPALEADPLEPAAAADEGGADRPRPSRGARLVVLGSVAVLFVTALVTQRVVTTDANVGMNVARRASRPLTSFAGYENHPALSPDGTRVAFVWNGEDRLNENVYVLGIDRETPIAITDDPASERHPAWSPDARRLAFLRPNDAGATLHVASSSTMGRERELARLNIGGEGRSYGLDWSPDGRFIAAQDIEEPGARRGIFLISTETGEKRRVTTPPDPYSEDRWPSFSPNGRFVAFARGRTNHLIYAVEIDDDGLAVGEVFPLTRDPYYVRGLDWAPDGEHVIFAGVAKGGLMELHTVHVETGRVETFLTGHGAELPTTARRASDSALLVAYVEEHDDSDLFRLSGPATPSPSGAPPVPRIVASSTRYEHSPRISPDGKQVAFVSHRSGGPDLWVSNSDGSSPRRVVSFAERDGAAAPGSPRWSRDGRFIAFNAGLEGQQDVFLLNVETGDWRRLTNAPSNEVRPSFSRDGSTLYITSDKSGRPELYKMSVSGDGDWTQITDDRGMDAFESSDGKWLYYTKRYGQFGESGVYRRPPGGGPEERVLEEGRTGRWALSDGGIYLYRPEGERGNPTIDFHPHDTLERRMLVELSQTAKFGTADALSAAPDDRWIIFVQKPEISSDLVLAVAP